MRKGGLGFWLRGDFGGQGVRVLLWRQLGFLCGLGLSLCVFSVSGRFGAKVVGLFGQGFRVKP